MKRYPKTDQIEKTLLAAGEARRRQTFLKGLSLWGSVGLFALLVFFFIDYLTRIPYPIRFLLVAGAAYYFGRRFWREFVLPLRKPLSPDDVALLVEARNPGLQSRLISALQFQRLQTIPAGVSEDLVDGVVQQALAQSEKLDVEGIIDRSWRKRGVQMAAGAVVLWLLVMVIAPGASVRYFLRLGLPFIEYPRNTHITAVNFPEYIPEGEATVVTITAAGDLPRVGAAYYTPDKDGDTQNLEILHDEKTPGTYRLALPPLFAPGELSIAVGDDEWGPKEVIPEKRPYLTAVQLQVTPPPHTNIKPFTADSGSSVVPSGSQVQLLLTPSKPLKEAKLAPKGENGTVPELKAGEANRWIAAFTADKSFSYTVNLTDKLGLMNVEPPLFYVSVTEDQPPVLRVASPEASVEIAAPSSLPVDFEVRDEYSVSEVVIKYQVYDSSADDPEKATTNIFTDKARPVKVFDTVKPDKPVFFYKGKWDNLKVGVPAGKLIRMWIEAKDNSPKGNTARSGDLMIRVISTEEYKAILMQRLGKQMENAEDVINNIKVSGREIEKLKDK